MRQLVLVKDGQILLDSTLLHQNQRLDLSSMALQQDASGLSLGLQLGAVVPHRFLPLQGQNLPPQPSRSLVPMAITLKLPQDHGQYLLIAGVNLAYIQNILNEVMDAPDTQIGVFRLLGDQWLGDLSLPKNYLDALVASGADESFISGTNTTAMAYAMRLSGRYPLGVAQGLNMKLAMGLWLEANRAILWTLFTITLGMMLLGGFFIRDVKKRMALQEELSLLFSAIEQSPITVMITDKHQQITYVNPAFSRTFGYSQEEVLGHKPSVLRTKHTEPQVYDELRKALASGHAWRGQFVNQSKLAKLVYVSATISPVRTGGEEITHFVGMLRDVSQLKQAEEDLRVAAVAFDSQEATFVTDADCHIVRTNLAFSHLTGYSIDQVRGQRPHMFYKNLQEDSMAADISQLVDTSGRWQGEIYVRTQSQQMLTVWMVVSSVKTARGEVTHYVGSFTDMTERKANENQIIQLAFYDPLTAMPNRRLFSDRLNQAIKGSERSTQWNALLMLDLDHFKSINDTLGHDVGDALLIEVAQRIQGVIRQEDTLARLGGDEFTLILEHLGEVQTDAEGLAHKIAEKVRQALLLPFDFNGQNFHISVSIGVTFFGQGLGQYDELLKQADVALYEAKAMGRNQISLFSTPMQQQVSERVALENDLRQALVRQEFEIYLQPQMDAQGVLYGAEVLLRWRRQGGDFVPPDVFIPVAERSDIILQIGDWVLDQALAFLQDCQMRQPAKPLVLAVNLSAKQFAQGNLVQTLAEKLQSSGVNPQSLKLELTEHVMLAQIDQVIDQMQAIRDLGVGIDLDDFGTGFSSLSYLKNLSLDCLKIDKSFVDDLSDRRKDSSIVNTIIHMVHSLNLRVIAEGVETQEQWNFLQHQGCDYFQGYLIARPMPLNEFITRYGVGGQQSTQKPTLSSPA